MDPTLADEPTTTLLDELRAIIDAHAAACSADDEALRRVEVAHSLEAGLKHLTACLIVEAETAGVKKQVVAKVTGHTHSSHMKQKYAAVEQFRRARVAADVTGASVTVPSPTGGWRVRVDPAGQPN